MPFLKAKICGLTEINQVETCLEYGASMCGFILFYPRSHRNLSLHKARELTSVNNAKSNVAVVVEPSKFDLKKIRDLNFQYYQIYGDQDPSEINEIKKRNNVKIIKALTVENKDDVLKYKKYETVSDIILFDSKGMEKSLSFDHSLLKYVPKNIKKMIAGNILIQDLEKISKMEDVIVDVSSAVETDKKKDLTKIKEFLSKVREINNEN